MAANVALPTPAGVVRREVVTAAELEDACEQRVPRLRRAADGRRRRRLPPGRRPREGKIKKSSRERLELVLEPTADVLAGLAAQRRDGQTLVGFAAEHGERALECAPRQAHRQAPRRARRQRHLTLGHRLRRRRQRGHDPQRGAGAGRASATCRAPARRRSPRRSSTPSRACGAAVKLIRWRASTTSTSGAASCSTTATTRRRSCR